MQDYQRQKVYDWENKNIRPLVSHKIVSIDYLRAIVNYMWEKVGMEFPPKVEINHMYKKKSTGNRYELLLAEHMTTEFITVHELAHALNCREDYDHYDMHGPNYVAGYCFLLTHFYKINEHMILATLKEAGVKINLGLYAWYKENACNV